MPEEPQPAQPTSVKDTSPAGGRRLSRRAFLGGGAIILGAGAAGGLAAGLLAGPMRGGNSAGASEPSQSAGASATPLPGATPRPFVAPKGDRRVEAAHLLRRAGFGATQAEIAELAALSRETAVDRLMDPALADDVDEKLQELGVDVWNNPGDLQRWWLLRMAYTRRPLVERMSLFWHNHFATAIHKVDDPWLMLQHVLIFRDHGLGSFRDLVLAVARDPAMLIWLDNRLNRKGKPNENYARELMELHTIGIGRYSEADIKEAARTFTGWTLERRGQAEYQRRFGEIRQKLGQPGLSDQDRRDLQRQQFLLRRDYPFEFRFNPGQHDFGAKTFLGQSGPFDGADSIDVLVRQDACADFICRKLFHYFVYDHPEGDICSTICGPSVALSSSQRVHDEAEEALIARLKAIYFDSGYQIAPIVRAILTAPEFYSDRAYRAKIRGPVEFVVSAARSLEATTDGRFLATVARQMGQVLFDPPNPAGWPGGAAWINGNAIISRANFANALASARPAPAGRKPAANFIQPERFTADPGISEAGHVVDAFVDLLLDGNITVSDRNALIEYLHTADGGGYDLFKLSQGNVDKKVRGLIYLILSSPLYQLS